MMQADSFLENVSAVFHHTNARCYLSLDFSFFELFRHFVVHGQLIFKPAIIGSIRRLCGSSGHGRLERVPQ